MKTLKESILDKQQTIQTSGLEAIIINWLSENTDYKENKNSYYIDSETHDIHVSRGGVEIVNKKITEFPNYIHFGNVCGTFDCNFCDKLTSLRGCPKKTGVFTCRRCTSLKTLEGSPESVTLEMTCIACDGLVNLKGAPKLVGSGIDICSCDKLESLEGMPNGMTSYIYCSNCPKLKSLKGIPHDFAGSLTCDYCRSLKSLEGCPDVLKYLNCDHTGIKNLKGSPKNITGQLCCRWCDKLDSLEGAPKKTDALRLYGNKKEFSVDEIRQHIHYISLKNNISPTY